MEEAAPLLGGSPTTTKRKRWQAAAAVATIGVVALTRGGRTATVDTLDALPPSTVDLIQPERGPKPLQMGHFGKWTVMASTRARMDETADALWWGMNMLERFRDYDADPAFPSYSYLGPTGCSVVQRRWMSLKHQPADDEMHIVWNSGNQIRNTATVDGRTLSLSAEEVFTAIHDLHVQTALTDNQFSGQKVGVFDVTGIERAVWGARDNLRKFGWPYRLLKGVGVIQDHNAVKKRETDLYIVRTLTPDGKILETTAVAANSQVAKDAFARVETDPSLRYPVKLPAWQFGSTSCGSDTPYIFCGKPRFNEKLFITQTNADTSDYTDGWPYWEGQTGTIGDDGLVNITRSAHTHVASTDPIRDALFLRKWLKHEPLTDFPDSDSLCGNQPVRRVPSIDQANSGSRQMW